MTTPTPITVGQLMAEPHLIPQGQPLILRDIFLVRGVIAIPKMFRRCKKLKLEVFTQFQLTSLLIKDSPGKRVIAS